MTLDDAGCCVLPCAAYYSLPMDRITQRIHVSFLREQRGSHSRMQGVLCSSDAAMVGASLKSIWKLLLREGKFIGRVLAGDFDQVIGLRTRERGLFSRSAKPATAAGDRCSGFPIPSPVRQKRRYDDQAGPGGCDKM